MSGREYVHQGALMTGLSRVNDELRKMCDGHGEVWFSTLQEWVYGPRTSELRFHVSGDAPEEAIKKAEQLSEAWSYAPIYLYPDDRPCEMCYSGSEPRYEYVLWF